MSILLPNCLSRRWLLLFSLLMPCSVSADLEQSEQLQETVCPETPVSVSRRRPGGPPRLRYEVPACRPGQLAATRAEEFNDLIPVPDRWRIVEGLGYPVNWLDPYHGSNPLKGDRPVFGKDWFVSLKASSISVLEPRGIPVSSQTQGSRETTMNTRDEFFFSQNFIFDTVLYKGDTVFRPSDFLFRFTPVINYNQTSGANSMQESLLAVQALYVEKHLQDVSVQYDFDSIRIGIQPFISDFRGFLLLDQQLGVRLFGTRENNIFQYNLAWLRRFRKNSTNLNDLGKGLADNDIFLANLYWQDLFKLGFTSQFFVAYNRNREKGTRIIADTSQAQPATIQENVRHDYDVVYLGYSGDGHFGRINFTGSSYYALGKESNGLFNDAKTDISAFFLAGEFSIDFDWFRLRLSGLHASGDDDPFDDASKGFDGIFQSPIFAGSDASFFIHQGLPLLGNKISLKRRNSFFNSLRSQDDPGQSNFTNPGINLIGVGADFDLLPELRVSLEANQIWFDETAVLDAVLGKKNIASNLGQDLSIAAIYRPFASQNLIVRLSAATLLPGQGYRDIYDGRTPYSVLTNIILTY